MTTTMRDAGREFLARGRFALVGASRDEKSFSRYVLRELLRRGYDVVPVNPSVAEMEGRRCFPSVRDVTPPVDAAALLDGRRPPAPTTRWPRASRPACATCGCTAAADPAPRRRRRSPAARAAGIEPIVELCPFMALPDAGWFHKLHGLLRGVHRRPATVRA